MEQKLSNCRICGKLMKTPAVDYRVHNDDPSCCQSCNNAAEPQNGGAGNTTFIS